MEDGIFDAQFDNVVEHDLDKRIVHDVRLADVVFPKQVSNHFRDLYAVIHLAHIERIVAVCIQEAFPNPQAILEHEHIIRDHAVLRTLKRICNLCNKLLCGFFVLGDRPEIERKRDARTRVTASSALTFMMIVFLCWFGRGGGRLMIAVLMAREAALMRRLEVALIARVFRIHLVLLIACMSCYP